MQSSPVLEIELHKTFETYPTILARILLECGFLTKDEIDSFDVFHSAFRNRLRLSSGIPDMIVGAKGSKNQFLIEIKTISRLQIEQIVDYHDDILRLIEQGKYPYRVEKIIPLFIVPQVDSKVREELDKKDICFIELENLRRFNIESIIRERDRNISTTGKVRKETPAMSVHRATYILPLLDFLYEKYNNGIVAVPRADILGARSKIMVSNPVREPITRPAFARLTELLRVSELFGLVAIHRRGSSISVVNLTEMGRNVAKEGAQRSQKIVFTQNQLAYLVPAIMDDPFKNFLINGIFLMIETIIELNTDNEYSHLKDVFAHKVGICRKSPATANSTTKFYLNYCEDLGFIILLPKMISPTELGRLAYRVMRTNEVESVAKLESYNYLTSTNK